MRAVLTGEAYTMENEDCKLTSRQAHPDSLDSTR